MVRIPGRTSPTTQHNQRRRSGRPPNEAEQPEYERDTVLAHSEWKRFVQRTAQVVYIAKQVHSRYGVGFLSIFPDCNPNFAKFSPTDPCVPRMKIPKAQCPKDFFARPRDFERCMFVCKIAKWEQGRGFSMFKAILFKCRCNYGFHLALF